MKKIIYKIITIFIVTIICFILNFLLEIYLIPDPCYYHSHEGSWLFQLFYDTPSGNGGHPWPSNFNLTFTLLIGIILGLLFSRNIKN